MFKIWWSNDNDEGDDDADDEGNDDYNDDEDIDDNFRVSDFRSKCPIDDI